MRSVTNWLMILLAIMFWIFRVVVTFCQTMNIDFMIQPINTNTEIAILFATFICIILLLKQNIIGGLAYFGIYAWYFGTEAVNLIINNENIQILNLVIYIFAVLLAFANLIYILASKVATKKAHGNKKTDWFYKGEQFDRSIDERADKNNYRII